MTKKHSPEIINAIIESLEAGSGRIKACKKAGIHYDTFCDWTDSESPRYDSDFSVRIKKAEKQGDQVILETCENVIMQAATRQNIPVWQAAAWMLERKFGEKYAAHSKQNLNVDLSINNEITALIEKFLSLDEK